jgi:hypothetical protein
MTCALRGRGTNNCALNLESEHENRTLKKADFRSDPLPSDFPERWMGGSKGPCGTGSVAEWRYGDAVYLIVGAVTTRGR